ncbi:hypothetical protein BDZ89DRAFT_888347, partial [Hymenopellis radicata]
DVECPNCHALHWISERLSKSSQISPRFGKCCLQGKVNLPLLPSLPPELEELFNGTNPHSAHFLTNIRAYNAAFAMVSLGIKTRPTPLPGHGPSVFRLHGALYHNLGQLLPGEDGSRKYAQLYILDSRDEATAQRMRNNTGLRFDVMNIIHDVLYRYNIYVPQFLTAAERLQRHNAPNAFAQLSFTSTKDKRRYNLPTASEIAVVISDNVDPQARRDIMLELRQGGAMKRIYDTNPAYQALYYVLLFPRGEHGWEIGIPYSEQGSNRRKFVTQLEYYAYRLHERRTIYESAHIFSAKYLLQQYIVDAWAQIDQSRLRYLSTHQDQLRVDLYSGLADAVAQGVDMDLGELGQRLILPSSYIGGTRHMFQLLQDSLALARHFAKPDLFMTMTANP